MAVALTSVKVQMALGGSWRHLIDQHMSAGQVTAWYRAASNEGQAKDASGNGYHGTFSGGVTVSEDIAVPEGGYSYLFDGTNDYISVPLPATGTTLTIECWLKPNTPSGAGNIISADATDVDLVLSPPTLNFIYSAASHLSSGSLTNLAWNHVVVSISAGNGTFYINGSAAGTFTGFPGFTPDHIGTTPGPGWFLKAYLDEMVIYNVALSAGTVTAHYATRTWTDVSTDVLASPGVSWSYGIPGNGPTDHVPDVGYAEFWLRNDTHNSGSLRGYYSPNHASCRSGFTFGVLTRILLTYSGTDYQQFIGKIQHIEPTAGTHGQQRTRVRLADMMSDLIEAELRNVTLQIGQSETQLMIALMDALPVTAQPLALAFDTALDTISYAFADLGQGMRAVGPLADLVLGSMGYVYLTRSGVFLYTNRNARAALSSSYTITNEMSGLVSASNLDGVFNRFRFTVHPKSIDAAATTRLWEAVGSPEAIASGDTVEVWGSYYKAAEPSVAIGGTAQIAPVATTDYKANTVADGTGTDKTANVTVTAEPFASTVKFTITNNDAGPVYMNALGIRGKGLYDEAPQTVEVFEQQPYGERPISIDLRYQESAFTAAAFGTALLAQYSDPALQVQSLTFYPQRSNALMLAALLGTVGDRITITETQTGISNDVWIQRVSMRVTGKRVVECTFGLSPN